MRSEIHRDARPVGRGRGHGRRHGAAEPEFQAGARLREQSRSNAQRLQAVVSVPRASSGCAKRTGAGDRAALTRYLVPVPKVSEQPRQGGV